MGDIRIIWDPATGTGDFAMDGADLATGHELETAVLISLFTEAEADPGDIVPDTIDRRGWWADTYAALEDPTLPTIGNDRIGSKLWQVFVRPRNQDTLNWLRDAATKALGWMLTDGVASAIDVEPLFINAGGVGLIITITANGTPTRFSYVWSQEA
jgi:phage gp46-like protein